MLKKSFLDSIQSPSPCCKNWDKMIGDERVRFCHCCEKSIYNLSAMKRKEAKKMLINSSGKLCIRYERRADGSIITADCKLYGITRTSRLAAGVLSASLAISALTNAQNTQTENMPNKSVSAQSKERKNNTSKNFSQFSLTLFDLTGATISDFKVQVINQATKKVFTSVSDESGIARFNSLPHGRYGIVVEAQSGFSKFSEFIELRQEVEPNVEITVPLPSVTIGVFIYDWSEVPLFRAIAQDDDDAVIELINTGFNINIKDKNGQTALHVAVEHGNLEIVRFLLNKGAKVNVKDKSKRTSLAMIFTSFEDDVNIINEIFRLLVLNGADVDVRDSDGETLLMLACEDENVETVRFLLTAGANPNLKDDEEDGETAYQKTDSVEIKQLLVQYGARVEN